MTDDIVARLRESAEGWDECDNEDNAALEREAADEIERFRSYFDAHSATIQKQADEIERLRVIVHALEIDYGENADEIERLREELAQLHEAVKPSVLDCTEYCFEECQRGTEPIENCACFKVGVAIAVRERNT